MEITWGWNVAELSKGNRVPVKWDSRRTINGHIMMVGDTGTGKTTTLKNSIGQMLATSQGVRVHVFDAHGDIVVPGESMVLFSESADFGFNPLEINPDPHFGGVRKRIQSFLTTINRTSVKLGHKQQAVLRNVLLDLYAANGFKPEDPSSWSVPPDTGLPPQAKPGVVYLEVPFDEKDRAKEGGAVFDPNLRAWYVPTEAHRGPLLRWPPKVFGKRTPTLNDAVGFANYRLKAMFVGANQTGMRYLEEVQRAARHLAAKQKAALKELPQRDDPDLELARSRAIEAYTAYVNAPLSGREIDDMIRYDSVDVLKSVVDRLENLKAIGIFRNTPPPFDRRRPVWRYNIAPLGEDEKRLFVDFRLEALFAAAVQRGVQPEIREVIVLDEAHLYVSHEPDHILNKLIKEARKFGIALVLASQAPTHFSDDLIAGVGTKVLLGLDTSFWALSQRKLRLTEGDLKAIVPQARIVVQMKLARELQSRCLWVNLK